MKRMIKKGILFVVSTIWVMTACSCLRTQTDVTIKRSGKAVVTAEVLMDDESVKENYGMPTNFYDAVEGDFRFSRVTSWDKQYTSEQYDGLNYIGIKISKEAEKKEVGAALSALYGDYAKIDYDDSNFFGNRKITIKVYGNGNRLQEEELESALAGGVLSTLTVSVPGSIKSTTGNKISDNRIQMDLTPILTGEITDLSAEIKFFDWTFFIPIAIAVVVITAAAIVILGKVSKEKKLNAGLTSIKLDKKSAKAARSGMGGFGGGIGEGPDDFDPKPKKSSMFAKKTPKYTSTETSAAPAAAPAPAPAPSVAAKSTPAPMGRPAPAKTPTAPAPAAPTAAPAEPVASPSPRMMRRRPSPSTFTAEPAPAPVQSAPAEPEYTQPVAETAAPAAEEKPSYTAGSAKASYGAAKPEFTYQAGTARSTAPVEPELVDYSVHETGGDSCYVPKSEYTTNGLEDQTSETMDYGSNLLKREAKEINTSSSASARISSGGSASSGGYVAGGAKFNKAEGSVKSLGSGTTAFSPRSTAPNFQYFVPGYHEEHKPAENAQELEKGSTVFAPRSTAPNMDYFMPGHHEEHEKANNVQELEKGSTVFSPRSTAPNIGYGTYDFVKEEDEKEIIDPFHVEEEKKPTPTSTLFTPRSTAPNLSYGKKDDFVEETYAPAKDPFFEKDADVSLSDYEGTNPQPYEENAYGAGYDDSYYDGYENNGYDNGSYDNGSYDDGGYDNGSYDNSYDTGYESNDGYYEQSEGYYEEPQSQGASIYNTNGYEDTGYQSANVGRSEKSAAIKEAYGGSKLGTGAYVGGAATGATIGRSVNNVGGYVDPEMVNTSSYGSDPFSGSPLPKLGEAGAGGGGMFSFDATGTFGGSSTSQGGFGSSQSSFGSSQGGFGSASSGGFGSGSSYSSSTYGKKFSSGGTGKFDFSAASGNRKCPFCKEPIRDDDTFCVACGAELSRPYGSF
ncbi:MAG: zinc ribbon domain-containing protein [Lachnospiraceae bacterium]|nr:zinc ribbon domain-containing protein [Lachnospiraceae bacterium]